MTGDDQEPAAPKVVHTRDGFVPAGTNERACCSCGHATAPHASREEAAAALATEHRLDLPLCALCSRGRWDTDESGRSADLEILTVDGPAGGQVLVCKTDQRTCHQLADQSQMHADRAAADALGFTPPPPRLRSI